MNLRSLIPTKTTPNAPQRESLEDLIAKAESYGTLVMSGSEETDSSPAGYYVRIKFRTQANITLQAESSFRVPLITGLREAIANAEQIRGQFK